MWFAYGLRSEKDGWLYIGMSTDVEKRTKEHNAGYNRSTRSRAPFRLIYVEACASRLEARKRERFLKSGAGREFLKAIPAERMPLVVGTGGGNSAVESRPSKPMVAGSNPVPRSI